MLALDMLRGAAGAQPTLDLNFTSGTLDSRVTYTGASLATLTDATGAIAYKPHNLLLQSEAVHDAAWSKTSCTASAGVIIPSVSSAQHYTHQSVCVSGTTYKLHFDVRAAGYQWLKLVSSTSYLNIDAINGVIGLSSGMSATISSNGDGSFRVIATFVALETRCIFNVAQSNNASWDSVVFAGDGTSGIGVTRVGLNVGALQTYTKTTSAAYYGPRFTYDPVTHAALGLLIEEQRTNLLTYSEQFDNAAWPLSGSTVTANATTGPDGNATADKLVESVGAGAHLLNRAGATVSLASVMSVYAKAAERTQIALQLGADVGYYNLSTGAVISGANASIVSVGNGWYRCILTGTPVNTNSLIYLASGGAASYTGDGTSGVYIWGAQLEAGAFATSYIPTTSASVTRAADSATMTGSNFSSWFNATQGTFVVEGTRPTGLTGVCIAYEALSAARGSGDIISADINDKWTYQSSGFATEAALSQAWTSGTLSKQAGSYSTNNFKACLNGGTVLTDSVGTVTAGINQLRIGDNGVGNHTLNAPIARIRYYNTALTNAQLQALTT